MLQYGNMAEHCNDLLGFFTPRALPPIKHLLIARDFAYQGAMESVEPYNRKELQLSVSANWPVMKDGICPTLYAAGEVRTCTICCHAAEPQRRTDLSAAGIAGLLSNHQISLLQKSAPIKARVSDDLVLRGCRSII